MNYTLYLEVHVLNTISEYSENLHFEYHLWKIFLYGFTIKPGKCLCRWQSCFKSFAWKCEVETDRFECSPKTAISTTACMSIDMIQLECSPKTVISTPARVSVDMSHLEGVEVEIALCGFLMLFVTLLYFSRCDREQISMLLYCIKTKGSRWHHVRVCFSSSCRTIVIL